MAAITSIESSQTLTSLVQRWDRRWRIGQTLIWLPRVLAPALIVGLVLAISSRIRPFLLPDQIALIIFIGMIAGALVMAASIWLKDRSIIHAARRFDLLLGLNERISTAIELLDGRIVTTSELAQLQLQDASQQAHAAHPSKYLPLQIRGREWLGLALLAIAVAALLLLPNPQDTITHNNAAAAAAIEEAGETLQQITEQVAADSTLSESQRRDLLNVLEASSNTLSQQDVSPEEAFAAATAASGSLESLAEMFDQQLNASNAAATAANAALQSPGETPQNNGSDAYQQLAESLQQMAAASNTMSSEQQQALAERLEEAAEHLAISGNQGLQQAGQQMQQAAEQMQAGDPAAASNAMQQAAQSAQQGGQQSAQMQQSAGQAGQQAQNASNAAENIAQSQQAQSANPNTSESSQQGGGQEDSQAQEISGSGEADPQQSSQGGQQSGEQSDQSGSGSGEQGQMGSEQGAESGQLGDSPQSGGQSAADTAAQGQSNNQLSGAAISQSGAGAGDEQSTGQTSSSGSQNMSDDQSNNADGQGERGRDELIYAPRRLGGPLSGEESFLQSDDPNAPIIQGEFAQNPIGSASVPYSSVFGNYANAASQALENGYVPLGLRDLIRSYFSSLEPSSASGG